MTTAIPVTQERPTGESPGAVSGFARVVVWLGRRDLPAAVMAALMVAMFALSFGLSNAHIVDSSFHPDESRWVNRARYISNLRDPLGDEWSDKYLIRGQPPLGSYVIGLGLLLQGRDTDTNLPWVFTRDTAWNIAYGSMPSWDDLEAARRTNAVVGALAVALLCLALMRTVGPVGAVVGAGYLAVNPLHTYLSSTALSDETLALLMAAMALLMTWYADRPTWGKTIGLAALFGLGASVKLSPLILAVGFAGLALLLVSDRLLVRLPVVGRSWERFIGADGETRQRVGWMWLSLPLMTFAFFVLSYPYLWSNPIGRTRDLFEFRNFEMKNQARIWADRAVETRFDALVRIWRSVNSSYSSTDWGFQQIEQATGRDFSGHGLDMWLVVAATVGLGVLVLRFGVMSRVGLATLVLGMQFALIVGGLRVDFERYYLPPIVFFAFLTGVGAGGAVMGLGWLMTRRHPDSGHLDSQSPGRR